MKTLIYFLCTCFLATGIYMVAIGSLNAVPGILVACGLWAWFFWGWHKRRQKAAKRGQRERRLEEWLRRRDDFNR
ncbi:hypothetical protein ABDD95_07695 [Mucilaginibacter sp. PAMB04274]|uniref:hypothetical protein n=1 Tax=Mucilaginibacter sp. PAMB04274 TaxID=3138568 RepID=UPI0031F6796F